MSRPQKRHCAARAGGTRGGIRAGNLASRRYWERRFLRGREVDRADSTGRGWVERDRWQTVCSARGGPGLGRAKIRAREAVPHEGPPSPGAFCCWPCPPGRSAYRRTLRDAPQRWWYLSRQAQVPGAILATRRGDTARFKTDQVTGCSPYVRAEVWRLLTEAQQVGRHEARYSLNTPQFWRISVGCIREVQLGGRFYVLRAEE